MKQNFTIKISSMTSDTTEKLVIIPMEQEDVGLHDHQFFEFAYITGGSARHILEGNEYLLKKGDYFFVDYGSLHGYTEVKDFSLINCLFLPEVLDDSLRDCRSLDELIHSCLMKYHKWYFGKTSVNHIFHDESGRIYQLISGIEEEYYKKRMGYEDIFRCRLLEILILTMREVIRSGADTTKSAPVMELIRYVNRKYNEPSLLMQFCQEYHYNTQYFSRLFKKETGINVMQYIQRVRIEKCCELLTGSDLQIGVVAQRSGYSDMKFFNKIFRRIKKMSPREYRKINISKTFI